MPQIDVFLTFKPTDRNTFTRTRTDPKTGRTTVLGTDLETGPSWVHLQTELKSKGYTLNVLGPQDPPVFPTVDQLWHSLASSEVTVFVGHGRGDTQVPHFVSEQLQLDDGFIQSPDGLMRAKWSADGRTITPTPGSNPVKVKINRVTAVFTCNSDQQLPEAFDVPEGSYLVTNDGGADGETRIGTLEQVAYDFIRTYAFNGGFVQGAMAAAQATMREKGKKSVKDKGDTLNYHTPLVPPRKTQPDPGDYYK